MNQRPVAVVVCRPFARLGQMLEIGQRLQMPFDEAAHAIRLGVVTPDGAPEVFGAPPLRSWATTWGR